MTTEYQYPTVTEDTATPYADSVKAYMEENNISTEDATLPTEEATKAHTEVHEELLKEDSVKDEAASEEATLKPKVPNDITLQTDTAFIDDELERMTNLSNVTVKGFEYEITRSEKDAYLRCMLNDQPVILTIRTLGSNTEATCRSLSVYEIELATQAGIQFVEEIESQAVAEIRWRAEVQKYRLAMQLVKFNRTMMDYLQFKPEPGKLQEHINLLRERATQVFSTMSVLRWKVSIHALNIFEYKLNRLNELALSPDFLSPDE